MKKFKNKFKMLHLILSLSIVLSGCGINSLDLFGNNIENSSEDALTVRFIDAGQGDCELLTFPDGTVMLIDGGDRFCSNYIVDYLEDCGVEKIDFLVATHPHADHIGGLDDVLESIPVSEVIMPKISESDIPTTQTYEDFLMAVKNSGCKVTAAKQGISVYEGENTSIKLLAPCEDNYSDLNGYSAVVKVEYGEKFFLFTGDADKESEEEMLLTGDDLNADVLKVGHHGSSTSTTDEFLDAVNPDYAVISVGVDNKYGHPHLETLEKLKERNTDVYTTSADGTVIAVCDGENIEFSFSRDNIYEP